MSQSSPDGCRDCGTDKRNHGWRHISAVGSHQYAEPTDAQRLQRMRARRLSREEPSTTTDTSELSAAIRSRLEGAGLTSTPEEFGDGIHGWRCEHPAKYGRCDCLESLTQELVSEVRKAQADALRGEADRIEAVVRDSSEHQVLTEHAVAESGGPYLLRERAEQIEREQPRG